MKSFIFLFFISFPFSVFSQAATKQDIKMLVEQMREDHRILREDINKRFEQVDKRFEQMQENMNKRFEQVDRRFEQMQENMNKRFELMTHIMYWMIGVLSALVLPLYFLLWKQYRTPNIYQLEQQLYQAEPEIKARIYLHLRKSAEKTKASISIE